MLTGDEYFSFDGMPGKYTLNDFWAWNSSDLLNNTLRGAFAEFLVSAALNLDLTTCRTDWDSFDVLFPSDCGIETEKGRGFRIEVKSSAYLQAWSQPRLSRIQFSIRPARSWSSDSGYGDEVIRHSDLYVFCLFACKDKESAYPLQLEQWEFYTVPTAVINENLGSQSSLSFPSLLELNPLRSSYEELADAIGTTVSKLPYTPPVVHIV